MTKARPPTSAPDSRLLRQSASRVDSDQLDGLLDGRDHHASADSLRRLRGPGLEFCVRRRLDGAAIAEPRDDATPAAVVGVPPLPAALRAESLPAAVLHLDAGHGCGNLDEGDLDVRGVSAVGADVPEVRETTRGFPGRDLAPLALVSGRRSFVD